MPFDLCKIGQLLKYTREEKGLTLDKVSNVLLIKKRLIAAIESGDWDSLPPPVYVKGYVNQYAALLDIVDLLEAEENQPSPEGQRVVTTARKEGAPKWWTPKNKLIAASAMGAVAVGFLVFQNLPKKASVAPPAQSMESTHRTVQTAPKIQAVEANANNQPVKASPVAAEPSEKLVLEPKKLTIMCQERTWVRIVIDGLEQKEFMLKPEEVVMVNAKENFDLLIGNAGGVKLFYNGKDTGFTGKDGEVKHLSLP
ncbi:MAG: RodZ domain-containing protein [Syntrophorhabdales bacterium]|jgi:cytoskeletal protein RodZ